MCISAWVRDKIGVIWGIERGWYTGEGTGNAKCEGQQGTLDLTTRVAAGHRSSTTARQQQTI